MGELLQRILRLNAVYLCITIMRIRKQKPSDPHAAENEAFGRLYHTIPNMRASTNIATDGRSDRDEQPVKQPRKWKRVLKRVLIVLAIVLALSGLWLGWKLVANAVKLFGWGGLADIFHSQKLKGEDVGRVNILLAGNSADDPGHGGGDLTDSIMVVSINTKDKTGGYILSVPRDLYVNIPGFGYAKINEAYQDGQRSKFSEDGYAAGGMGLLEKTITQYFGVQLNYYALVNYTGLQQAVDAVGGVQVTIASSDPRGLYDPSLDLQTRQALVKLPNGVVTLNGRMALDLSRARGDSYGSYGYAQSDFTRTENQRKILVGLKDKASSLSTLSNPIKLGQLFDSLGGHRNIKKKSGEARRLYDLSKQIPTAGIKSESLNNANGKNLLTSYRTRSGQSALVPVAGVDDFSAIQAFVSSLQPASSSQAQ